ncbi:peptidylprolyl isomerase [Puccinia graminis f. sp. tritici CRL 75-36-700-3]|uniref:FK506-binding protein n=1 Tax=Puccinia graminis f. sp. tritici (strain CRL 75-36-700-3 / race SCCL) TaxID=418459 RepID=E3KG79_PUCGT|nr:peptidylprolyl isomerase [Puccinia graminis f. sp. tritici CRL 75-36-700-3]EFP83175.1 peptidylprolyl isomerase [Puccinia graminis f. sp. tritici CRL 75-36-700-3]
MTTLFSAIVKPDKPLLYLCDESTHITNIAVCPITNGKKPATLSTIPPFVTILKLQYEGPVVEGENDDDDDKENVNSSKPTAGKPDKKQAKKAQDSDDAGEEEDDEDDDSDFSGMDIEAKEVVVGCFTPNILQLTTDLYLAPNDQYRFVITGSAEYEVHLLGRYISDSLDEDPSDFDSEGDSEDEMDELLLDEISTDEEDGEGPRIEEIEDDDEQASKKAKATKSITAAPAKNEAKSNKPTEDKKSNKRPLEDKEADGDVSMADSAAGTTDGQPKLSKSQRKKLKKAQQADAPGGAKENDGEAKAADAKKSPAKEAAKTPSTVTLPSGLKIIDTKVGQGADAKAGQSVSMRYIGKLNNGKVFDSNTKGKPFNFKLGRGEVIKGWDEGIKGMKLGGERKLIVPANLAYGKSGAPPDIPPNSVLTFEVKLLAIK